MQLASQILSQTNSWPKSFDLDVNFALSISSTTLTSNYYNPSIKPLRSLIPSK